MFLLLCIINNKSQYKRVRSMFVNTLFNFTTIFSRVFHSRHLSRTLIKYLYFI
jgi:hypothetical protein